GGPRGGGRGRGRADRVHRPDRPPHHAPAGRSEQPRRDAGGRADRGRAAGLRGRGLPLRAVPVRDAVGGHHGADRRAVLPLPGPPSKDPAVTAVLTAARPAPVRERARHGALVPLLALTALALALTVYSVSVSGAGLPFWQALQAAVGVHNG